MIFSGQHRIFPVCPGKMGSSVPPIYRLSRFPCVRKWRISQILIMHLLRRSLLPVSKVRQAAENILPDRLSSRQTVSSPCDGNTRIPEERCKEPPRPSAQKSSASLPKPQKPAHHHNCHPFPVCLLLKGSSKSVFFADGNTITESPLRNVTLHILPRSPGAFLILLHSTMPDLPQDIVQTDHCESSGAGIF